jgi:hypothetical protein
LPFFDISILLSPFQLNRSHAMDKLGSTAWVMMEKPATRASPEEGGNSVVSILIVVVPGENMKSSTQDRMEGAIPRGSREHYCSDLLTRIC